MNVERIVSANLPVLCVDTCSLLDIMRDPTRDDAKPAYHIAALKLIELATQNKILCLLAQQVDVEFQTHDQSIQDDANAKIEKLRKQIDRIDQLSAVYGSPGTTSLVHLDNHVQRARQELGRWLNSFHIVIPEPDIPMKAFTRMNACLAPAARGKDSSKDCLVYETYLHVWKELRNAKLSTPLVFLSSNTKEYYAGHTLNPHIANELTPLNVQYSSNAGMALHSLGMNQ